MDSSSNASLLQSQQNSSANQTQKGLTGKFSLVIRISSLVFLLLTVALASTFGRQNSVVSHTYYLYVTPPSFFFMIWSVIFSLIILVNIINTVRNIWNWPMHLHLAINNLLLIVWVFVFDIDTDPTVFTSCIALIALVPNTLLFWRKAGKVEAGSWMTYLTRNSYALFLGWVLAAANLNLGMVIVYWWGASKTLQMAIFWAVVWLSAFMITGYWLVVEGGYGLKSGVGLWLGVGWGLAGSIVTALRCLKEGCVGPVD